MQEIDVVPSLGKSTRPCTSSHRQVKYKGACSCLTNDLICSSKICKVLDSRQIQRQQQRQQVLSCPPTFPLQCCTFTHRCPCFLYTSSADAQIISINWFWCAEAASTSSAVPQPVAQAPSSQQLGQPPTSHAARPAQRPNRQQGSWTREPRPRAPKRYPVRISNLTKSVIRSDVLRLFARFNITEGDVRYRSPPPIVCSSRSNPLCMTKGTKAVHAQQGLSLISNYW